ncbi:MAG: type VI secretion system ImpA family N-terminal domain-containing protein [Planctomycetes bacterium]|nr:type VI secretion system ImpA family N-terminal domain-containing protein [Planctomycetota bacterium]
MTIPSIDFDVLTGPIPGDQPAGVRLPPDVCRKMENARKEFEPHPTNPSEPPVAKKPDWTGIIELATDSLAKTSKDLLAAVRLVEALARRDGFAGLRAGLELLRRLVADCWDRMHPLVAEPADLEARAGPFLWLCDAGSGAWFPPAVGKLPLLKLGKQPIGLDDWRAGQLDGIALTKEALASAVPFEETTIADVAACCEHLDALEQALNERMDKEAPSVAGLRDVLRDCQGFLKHVLPSDDGSSETNEDGAEEDSATAGTGGLRGRAQLYRMLARLAEDLARMEPHSPIPDLLRWAVKLGAMPFRELIQELVREPTVLADIRRQLGIKDPASSEAKSEPEA